ncbi:signal peptidase II [Mucilaginibacter gossypiicola]|uniref:Lipoprotein signal peptidase n=1 Tax=Mucilaginibacter gossypiicola TaxID=551995 RepID=A0A1H8SCJ0_9SPHI|nr:signal peptidase II [Mucilaginibacter gossypiicola]SEO76226.1 signal peptidase II [Mucilaginibacter gossypiicola]
MNRKGILRILGIVLILVVSIALDRVTKIYVRNHIHISDNIFVIKNFFTILHAENTGAFLSLGDSLQNPWKFILLSLLPLLALAFGVFYVMLKPSIGKLTTIGIVLVIAGGAGNLYDRMLYGSVTDFMHMNFGIFQTGVFNVADVSIMIGMGLILLESWQKDRKAKKEQGAPDTETLAA